MKIRTPIERDEKNGIVRFDLPIKAELPNANRSVLPSYAKFAPVGLQEQTDEDEIELQDFKRADMIFYGIDQMNHSYRVDLFLNNPKANGETELTVENGYAGNFVVLGHGGCYGGYGHCDQPSVKGRYDPRIEHPLAKPVEVTVEVTGQLKRALRVVTDAQDSVQVSLVPSCSYLPESEELPANAFKRPKKVELVFYN